MLALTSLLFTSCKKDDRDTYIRPTDVTAVAGQYSGEITVKGSSTAKYTTKFTIGGVGIDFNQIPLNEIMPLVVKDASQAQAALVKTPYGQLQMDYSAVATESGIINVFATAKEMKFDVLENGKTKKVIVTFKLINQPVYTRATKTIDFEVQTTQITVDGTAITAAPINYKFLQCKNLTGK